MIYPGWIRALKRGPVTTSYPGRPDPALAETVVGGSHPAYALSPGREVFSRSLAIRHIDAGSCNGCESELQLLNSAVYDLSRFGFIFTPSPKHADLLLVTGVVTNTMVPIIQNTYESMPAPKRVVAVGGCALASEALLASSSSVVPGGLAALVPVDAEAQGCPPTPLVILDAILRAVGRDARAEADRETSPPDLKITEEQR